jgi:MFS family permease
MASDCSATDGPHGLMYLRFFLTHPRVLSFGVLLTLFSSFGQTFLISIFVPRLLIEFRLDTAQFGAIYAGATLASAASLPLFGRVLDRVTLRAFSLAVGLGLATSCFAMALAPNVVVLFLAILGLRLTGQGLLSLTASTTMARVFTEGRGKALSVSGLGYPLGEGLLPMAIVLLIHAAGWRLSWAILGGIIAVLLLPAMASLLRDVEPLHENEIAKHKEHPPIVRLWRDPRFYLLLPGTLFLPVVLTALFLCATKSTVSMLGIFGTALGPLLLGALLKAGVTFHVIVPACAILGLLAVGVSFLARSNLREANANIS